MAKEVIVKLKNDQGFSSPSQDIRQILMIELKGFFAKVYSLKLVTNGKVPTKGQT